MARGGGVRDLRLTPRRAPSGGPGRKPRRLRGGARADAPIRVSLIQGALIQLGPIQGALIQLGPIRGALNQLGPIRVVLIQFPPSMARMGRRMAALGGAGRAGTPALTAVAADVRPAATAGAPVPAGIRARVRLPLTTLAPLAPPASRRPLLTRSRPPALTNWAGTWTGGAIRTAWLGRSCRCNDSRGPTMTFRAPEPRHSRVLAPMRRRGTRLSGLGRLRYRHRSGPDRSGPDRSGPDRSRRGRGRSEAPRLRQTQASRSAGRPGHRGPTPLSLALRRLAPPNPALRRLASPRPVLPPPVLLRPVLLRPVLLRPVLSSPGLSSPGLPGAGVRAARLGGLRVTGGLGGHRRGAGPGGGSVGGGMC
jgi:hypothetical protein